MSRSARGLALRLYAVSVAQLLAVIAAALVVHELTLGAPPMMHASVARYAVEQIVARAPDRGAMRAELARARRALRLNVTLYSRSGTVTMTNVEPPLPLVLEGAAAGRVGRAGREARERRERGWSDRGGPGFDGDRGPGFDGDRGPGLDGDRGPGFDGDRGPGFDGDRGPGFDRGDRWGLRPDDADRGPIGEPPRRRGPPGGPWPGGPPREGMARAGRPLAIPLADGGVAMVLVPRPPEPFALAPPVTQAAWAVVIALVIAGGASVLLARSLARPLARLTEAAREVGRGNLGVRVKLRRNDELGELSDAFDDMADRLLQLLRAQQELMANVSHELRTPLARIGVALDLAAEGDAAMAREALGEIAEDVAELERLVADVLRMARLDLAEGRTNAAIPPVRPEATDARALLEKAVVRFRTSHPERPLELAVEGELPQLSADPVLLRRVIDNLLDNARKYSEAPITLRASATPERVTIAVIDRGIGIAAEDLPHVATPFFRTDRSRARKTGGLGLGLSLARRITEAHGGKLLIDSEVGVGTTVRVVLPPRGVDGAPPAASQVS